MPSKSSFLLALLVAFVVGAGPALARNDASAPLTKVSSNVFAAIAQPQAHPVARSQFAIGEQIAVATLVTWPRPKKGEDAGVRDVVFRWWAGDRLANEVHAYPYFRKPPFDLWSVMPAGNLGVGAHRAELFVGGVLIDTYHFSGVATAAELASPPPADAVAAVVVPGALVPLRYDPGREGVYVLKVAPASYRVTLFNGKASASDFNPSNFTPARFSGIPDEGWIVGKARAGEAVAVDGFADRSACEGLKTVVFSVAAGQVAYVGDFDFAATGGAGVELRTERDDIDAARAYLQRRRPDLAPALVAATHRVLPVKGSCGPDIPDLKAIPRP
jgi:hypothetical protein